MSFKKGNKDAEKWTKKTALKMLEEVYEHATQNPNNYLIGKTLIDCGYYDDLWGYLGKKFADEVEIVRAIKKVETEFESRIVNSTMKGDSKSAAMAIFCLKNKYGYKDKTEQDLNIGNKKKQVFKIGDNEIEFG